jgi:intracellular septation protein A
MARTWWRYPTRRFRIGEALYRVEMRGRTDGLASRLCDAAGTELAGDFTPLYGPEALRNHRLAATLADGRALEVEAGYVSLWTTGICARVDGAEVHRSHPGRAIAYPEKYREQVAKIEARSLGEGMRKGFSAGMDESGVDFGVWKRNRVPLGVDIAMMIVFFLVAKLTDLPTAALIVAALGLALIVAQRFVTVDLIGGLALFGVVMALLGAGFALAFQDDLAVKMRGTVLGGIGAVLFLLDALLLRGRRLGGGLMRYMPYADLDARRLALGMGLMSLVVAMVSAGVALAASTDTWLLYNLVGDLLLVVILVQFVIAYARGRLFARSAEPAEAQARL